MRVGSRSDPVHRCSREPPPASIVEDRLRRTLDLLDETAVAIRASYRMLAPNPDELIASVAPVRGRRRRSHPNLGAQIRDPKCEGSTRINQIETPRNQPIKNQICTGTPQKNPQSLRESDRRTREQLPIGERPAQGPKDQTFSMKSERVGKASASEEKFYRRKWELKR